MVNKWTRDDLPSAQSLREYESPATLPDGSVARGWSVLVPPDRALDEIVDHLNAYHPKANIASSGMSVNGGLSDIERKEGQFWHARWKEAADQRDEYHARLDDAVRERDEALRLLGEAGKRVAEEQSRAEHAERERDEARDDERESEEVRAKMQGILNGVADALNGPRPPLRQWSWHDLPEKARQAMATRTAPAVSRADIEKAIRDEFEREGFYIKTPVEYRVNRVVCDLVGIEAEQATDPVTVKARDLARAGGIDFDEQKPAGIEMLIGMARHVLGGENAR